MTGCEWNPRAERALYDHEKAHALATVSLGRVAWRLCARCAALPEFKQYRVRKSLTQSKQRPEGG